MTPLRPGFAAELDPLRARRLLALVTSVLALAAACSSGDSDQASDASVRPFAEVQDSELSFEIDHDVSSEFSDAFAAESAIDGDLSTEWSTSGDGDDAFIELDLGETRDIAGVEFVTRTMADDTATASTFTVTVDGEMFGPFDASTVRTSRFAPVDGVKGRLVRFEVDGSTGGNTGAVEIRILAPTG